MGIWNTAVTYASCGGLASGVLFRAIDGTVLHDDVLQHHVSPKHSNVEHLTHTKQQNVLHDQIIEEEAGKGDTNVSTEVSRKCRVFLVSPRSF